MNILNMNRFDYLVALLAYFIIALIILNSVLVLPGTIGFFHDWFIGPYPEMNKLWASDGLYKWNSQIGNKIYDSDWIIRFILLPFSFLGGEVLSKGLLIFSITLSGFAAFSLTRSIKLSWYVCFAAGVIYIFSPIIFTKIIAGHVYYLIAYALAPLVIECFLKGKQKNNYRYYVTSGLLLSIGVIQEQFLVMVFLILLVFSLVDIQRIKKNLIGVLIIFSVTLIVTFSPIVLPQIFVKFTGIPFNIMQLLSYGAFTTSSDLAESFRMLGYEVQPYSYLNLGTPKDLFASNAGIIPSWIFYLDFLLPIAAFSVLFWRRDKLTISLSVIALVGLYLMKGGNPPFSDFFTFLFLHGLYIFRELWHVAFLYGFTTTFLISLLLEKIQHFKLNHLLKGSISLVLVCVIVVSNGYPLLLGNFAGYVQTFEFPNEYHNLYNKITSDPKTNVLTLPYLNPVRFDGLKLEGVDPFITHTPTMIFPSVIGARESSTAGLSMWLLSTIDENKTDNLGKILSGFGIKYLVLRKDFVSNYAEHTPMIAIPNFKEKWHTPIEPIIDSQTDMKIIETNPHYKIYQNENDAAKIFAPVTSVGGLSNYDYLLLLSNYTSLDKVALYPSISVRNSLNLAESTGEANSPLGDIYEIGRNANSFDARHGWTNNINSFGYAHLLASRVSQGLFTESPNSKISFELPNEYKNKRVEVWMKALSWDQGGAINIQFGQSQYPISLFSPTHSFHLFKVFEGKSNEPYKISMENIHGKNYVEGFYINEKDVLNGYNNYKTIVNHTNQKAHEFVANWDFSLVNNQSGMPLYWNDSSNICGRTFTCKINSTDGWNDKKSFQLFTKYPHNRGISSMIEGQEIGVEPKQQYRLLTHMKLNKWATNSQIFLQGFNNGSKEWYQIEKCPSGTNGPLKWQGFSCIITVPSNTTKIKLVLNPGWSPESKKGSKIWFDAISITKLANEDDFNIPQFKKLISENVGNGISPNAPATNPIKTYEKINPSLWNVHINTTRPTTIAFAEPYDQTWQATVYKNSKKIDIVRSIPLYGSINAFPVKQTGDLDIVLFFAPQYWHQVGLGISGIAIGFCIFYIIYEWKTKGSKPSPKF